MLVWLHRESSPPAPYKECETNPYTVFVLTAHAAHLLLGSWVMGKAWMDTFAAQWCSGVAVQSEEVATDAVDTPVSP